MTSSSYLVSNLLSGPGSSLGKLIEQAQAIADLNKTLIQVLDTELISHCRVGYYDKGVLTLLAQSAAFATRLRYYTPTLLSKLRNMSDWYGLCSIQIKIETFVVPMAVETVPVQVTPLPKLSAENADRFKNLAKILREQNPEDKLAASLEKLAKHSENS
ncbi:MAG TPA: DciA family protein [Candidatus Berkiella sp.]|nr:DciA family protein [Candidatus Berkiella sp.]